MLLISVTARVNLKHMLNERSQTQNNTFCMIPFMGSSTPGKLICGKNKQTNKKQKSKSLVGDGVGWDGSRKLGRDMNELSGVMTMLYILTMMWLRD